METSNSCYRFEKYTSSDGLYSSIDATYILHLEGDPRLSNIKKQLSLAYPTNIVYIVFNKGYKKCKKDLAVQSSMYDIIHANLEVFKHSKLNNYSNILICEDDFVFNPDIKNMQHITNVNKFLNDNDKEKFIYHLGALPFIVIPYNTYTYYSRATGMHAGIFTKSAQEYILNYSTHNTITDWDDFLINNVRKYIYYKSLCHQTITNTENSKNWNLNEISRYIVNTYIKISNFDKLPEPGTSYMYIFAKVFSFLLFLLIVFILHLILSYLNIYKFMFKSFRAYRLKR